MVIARVRCMVLLACLGGRLVRGEFNARVRRCVEPSHGRYLTEPAEQPIELSLQAVSRHTYQ